MATTYIHYGGQEDQVSHVMKTLFEGLGLWQYYPQRLTILDGLCLRKRTLHEVSSSDAKDIAWLVLQKIMSFDVQRTTSLFKLPDSANFDDDFDDDFVSDDDSDNLGYYHPMDVILALFLCADDFLRQDMMVRLNSCQSAIPLVLRDPFTQELTLPLWALSSIVKSWGTVDSNGKIVNFEHQLTKFEMPIVSIIRIGNHEVSKSKLLNNVISSSNQQDYFFHRDCNGGSSKRLLGNGIIDLCWYLPAGKEDIFSEPIAFVNLHGDACDLINKRQVDFLSKISTLCFVLTSGSFLNAESIGVLKMLSKFTLLIKEKPTNLEAEFPGIKVPAINLNKNEDEVKTRMRKIIKTIVISPDAPKNAPKKAIELIDNLAQKCQIEVDSKGEFFSKGKAIASLSFTKIHCKPGYKAENLPLQGKDMWQEWARHDKEQLRQVNRGGKDIQKYNAEIEEKKCQIRTEQRKQLTKLSPIMTLFIENLKNYDFKTINYYLHCLKLYLNNLLRDNVSQINLQYRETQNKLRHKFQNSGYDTDYELMKEAEKLKYELRQLQGKLNDLNFSVEHLLRETGQVYEASLERETLLNIKGCFSHLPAAVAKLVISGYPFEIMDGDATHVPIKWVQAVLMEVMELLGDPKIFVLSIIGLQSTGKSTLLNTVFGLQFNVRSGRCTRGAYMQLIPISEDMRSDIECDYILVIDTKGLRAPELDYFQSQKHDNELATFVIGLANNTLINIYGEFAGDMEDILQTSVHAFIRMREIELKPSCQFIHQNVTAGIKTGISHNRIVQKLDETTRYAATEEGCLHQFQHFRDVIKFDDLSDVHHFEYLWMGNPPMAPINPGYSASAQSLKLHIIKQIRETKCSRLSSFSFKMKDLWNALLAENFVFSFRNSLEIKAYSLLETSYSQWEWELKEAVLKWEENVTKQVKAGSSYTLDKIIEKILNPVSGELVVLISETHTRLHEKMAKYFKESKQSDVIVQWKSSFERRLEEQSQLLKKEKMSHFEQLCNRVKVLTIVRQEQDSYKQDIIRKVKDIAEVLKKQSHTKLTEEQVKVEFNKAWNEIIRKLPPVPRFQDPAVVKGEVETELISFLGRDTEKLIVKFQTSQRKRQTDLELIISKEHLSRKCNNDLFSARSSITNSHVYQAQKKTSMILNAIVPQFLEKNKKSTFSRAHVTLLLKELDDAIAQLSESEREFTFTRQYHADLFVTACNYATKHFEQMVEAFNRENDPVVCLEEELKDDLFCIFKNKYFQIEHCKAVASTLKEVLTKSLTNKIKSSLARQIVANMRARDICFKSKQTLKVKILIDLAETLQKSGDFQPFALYLSHPQHSFQNWIKTYAREYCDAREQGNGLSCIQIIAVDELKELIHGVEKQVYDLRRKCRSPTLSDWLSEFSKSLLQELGCHVDVSILHKTSGRLTIDIADFTDIVKDETIRKACEQVKKMFEKLKFDDMRSWEKRVEDILESALVGCCAQCPFCGEICDCTVPCDVKHKHQVEHHRVHHIELHGLHSNVLFLGACNSLVTGNDLHKRFHKTNPNETRLYKEYYTVYPDWFIPADLTGASTYWKWFVANYIHRLAEYYSCKVCSIPRNWQQLEWRHVKEELQRKIYS